MYRGANGPTAAQALLAASPGGPIRAESSAPRTLTEIRVLSLLAEDAALLEERAARPATPGPLDERALAAYAEALTKRAIELGHSDARVFSLRDALTTDSVSVCFIVEGADPVKLGQIKVEGGGFFTTYEFRKRLKSLPRPIAKGTTLTAQLIAATQREATRFWRAEGYLGATARLSDIRITASGAKASVIYTVNPGPRYFIEDVIVAGAREAFAADLQDMADRLEGRALTQSRMENLRRDVEAYCRARGYMGAQARVTHGVAPDRLAAAVRADVEEGTTTVLGVLRVEHREMAKPPRDPDSRFQRFRRSVAPRISDRVIRDMVTLQPGDALTERDLTRLRRRYAEMGCFDDIQIDTVATSEPAVRDLSVSVRDKPAGYASLMLGANDDAGLIGAFQVGENNVAGTGNRASLSASAGEDRSNVVLSYLDRHWQTGETLFGSGRHTTLLNSAYWRQADYGEYEEEVIGASVEMGRDWLTPSRNLREEWRLRLENVSDDPDEDRDEYEEDFGDYVVAALRYQVTFDSRDDAFLTRDGALWRASVESGAADGFLMKLLLEGARYTPLSADWTWGSRGVFGLMPTDADDVGISERLHAGGADDFRGFRPRGMGPVDDKEDDLHVGGATKLLFQNDLRYSFTRSMMGLLFVDAGTLDENAFGVGDWRASAGAGLRYALSPASHLFLDVAEAFQDEDTDDDRSVHFGVSWGF